MIWDNCNVSASHPSDIVIPHMPSSRVLTSTQNLDGTPVLDELGNPILAYTNDEIMSFAKIWTGFDYQQGRGNVEDTSWSGNRHDPMKIQAGWRDKFPKVSFATALTL